MVLIRKYCKNYSHNLYTKTVSNLYVFDFKSCITATTAVCAKVSAECGAGQGRDRLLPISTRVKLAPKRWSLTIQCEQRLVGQCEFLSYLLDSHGDHDQRCDWWRF